MNPTNTSSCGWKCLFNPFPFKNRSRLLLTGLGVLLLHLPISYFFRARFDGALDMHVVESLDSMMVPLTDVLIAWISMAVCLYLSARAFRASVTLTDIAGVVAVARFPLLLTVIPAKFLLPDREILLNPDAMDTISIGMLSLSTVILVLFLAWFLVVLFNGYQRYSRLEGWKLGAGFVGGIIVAEILSKAVLFST